MAEPLKHFTAAPNGRLFHSDGFNPVRDWNGLASSFTDAGLPAPSAAVTLAKGGTTGTIIGPLYAYQRWLDADGNVSNMSPISSEFSPSESSGVITGATNATPISIADSAHGLATGESIRIKGVQGNTGANGVWVITKVNNDNFTLNASVGNGDYLGGGTWNEGTSQIDYSGWTVPTDARATTRQILRTLAFGSTVVYVDKEDTTLSGTTVSSTNTDTNLLSNAKVTLTDINNEDLEINRRGEPPNFKPFLTHSNGRLIASGFPVYGEGSVAVTNGSATVTGIGTTFTSSMAGRLLVVTGDTVSYTINSINTSTQTITLSANYGGTTSAFKGYAIQKADSERLTVYWSSAGIPDSWNTTDDSLILQEDDFSGEPTGLMTLDRRVFFLFEYRIYRMTFDLNPTNDSYVALGPQRGCANNRCWIKTGDRALLLDRQGIYGFDGVEASPLSSPIQDLFQDNSDSRLRIKWEFSHYFHAVNDPEHEVARWFVSMGDKYPRHAVCYCYALGRQRWWVEEYPFSITSSVLGRLAGRWKPFLGAMGKRIMASDVGHLDGPDPDAGTIRGSVTGAGLTSITDSAASFASSGIIGFPVHIVSGTGRDQWRLVESVSGTTLFVDQPWDAQPDTTSVYQLGGIGWRFRGGWHRYAESDDNLPRSIELVYEPLASAAALDIQVFRDRKTDPINFETTIASTDGDGAATQSGLPHLTIDSTKTNGFIRKVIDDHKYTDVDGRRFLSLQISGVTNLARQKIYEMTLTNVQ
jgi:hypothetical protein